MLKTEHISFQYEDGKQALTDVSIDLEKGNIIGLIGANGSGKSTLFMQLLGINKPSDGTVYFEGKPLAYTKKALFALRKKSKHRFPRSRPTNFIRMFVMM